MERLWYNLSPNVLEEMIKFVPRSKDEPCPEFILEIEAITPWMDRYLLNLIDATNITIFCVTSEEYSKIFPIKKADPGSVIRILRYWIFRIQCSFGDPNKDNFKYIIMITDAELMQLPPTMPIVLLTGPSSKTPRIRGIVDEYPYGVSCVSNGESTLRFRLRDVTGRIGCSTLGAMYTSLHSILKKGVKVQLSHAMLTEVDPGNEVDNNEYELELNRFSVLNVYNPDDLTLLFAYSPRDDINRPDKSLKVNLSGESSNTSLKISKSQCEPSSSQQNLLSSKSLCELNSSQQNGLPSSKPSNVPTFCQRKPLASSNAPRESSSSQQMYFPSSQLSRETTSFRKEFLLTSKSSSQPSSSQKDSLPSSVLSSRPSLSQQKFLSSSKSRELSSSDQMFFQSLNSWSAPSSSQKESLPTSKSSSQPSSSQKESLPSSVLSSRPSLSQQKFLPSSSSRELSSSDQFLQSLNSWSAPSSSQKKSLPPENLLGEPSPSQEKSLPPQEKSLPGESSSSKITSLPPPKPTNIIGFSEQKCMNGKTPIQIASLNKNGICNSWIRGVVEGHSGSLCKARKNITFIQFHLRDDSAATRCTVWDPICESLNSVLKDGMILELMDAEIREANKQWNFPGHDYEIFSMKSGTILSLSPDGILLYRYMNSQSTITPLSKESYQNGSSKSSMILAPKYIDGKLPKNISSVTEGGFCDEWIRGVVEDYKGVDFTRTNRMFTRFFIHDNTGIINCTVWQPISESLTRVLKDSMIVEIKGFQVTQARATNTFVHNFQLYSNSRASIRVFTADDTLICEYLAT